MKFVFIIAAVLLCSLIWGGTGTILSIIALIFIFKVLGGSKKRYKSNYGYPSSQKKSTLFKSKPPYFAGKGQTIEIGSFIISDPMVYAVDSKDYPDGDASLLCLRRKVEHPDPQRLHHLPYWPQLKDFNPSQLGLYLEWLSKGRNDPEIELGYVFIYFYGLEKRALVDKNDIIDICHEVLRLLKIYSTSRSFIGYATGLIIHLMHLKTLTINAKLIDKIIDLQDGRIDEILQALILEYLAKQQKPMPAKWALLFARQDERSQSSVVLKRAWDEFSKLFSLKYKGKVQNKTIPKLGQKQVRVKYHAASPSLLYGTGFTSNIDEAVCTGVLGWKRQFSPVIKLFNECIEELKQYSRKVQNSGTNISASFEALPKELQGEMEHPQQQQWGLLLEKNEPSDCGAYLLPVNEIAKLREVAYRDRLTLGQSKTIAEFVESFGSSVEPDARFTGKSYSWNEKIAVLRLPDEPNVPERQNYALVSLVMPLAIEISLASGSFEDEEKTVVIDFLQERFMLDRNESLRQEALIEYYLINGVTLTGLKNKIARNFTDKQRKAIGKFLVMIAGAADGVCQSEVTALEKTFKSLGLEKTLVNKFVKELGFEVPEPSKLKIKGQKEIGGETIPPKTSKPIEPLDVEKIRKIKEESVKATEMLLQAMEEQGLAEEFDEKEISTTPTSPPVVPITKYSNQSEIAISNHILPFYKALILQKHWKHEELQRLARKHKVTVSAAIDDINTWADEELGDFLIEEGESFTVNLEILKAGEITSDD